jgi:hypothetical protein
VKRLYVEHTYFDPAGAVITAAYDNGETEAVTDCYIDKVGLLQRIDTVVTFSYTERNITRTADVEITVIARSATKIEIANQPTKKAYLEGLTFDPTGIVVKAYFDNGEEEFVTGWDYDKKSPLTVTDSGVTVSYGGKTAIVAIIVSPKILKAIMASGFPRKVVYVEDEYFDFLGLEIWASYENAESELITGWDYDKKDPLTIGDTAVTVSYALHGETQTLEFTIYVQAAPAPKSPEEETLNSALNLLPAADDLSEADLAALNYVLELLEDAENLTPEQEAKKAELEEKRQEIADNMPPVPEREYTVSYAVANGLTFEDIEYGENPDEYKNGNGSVYLKEASSATAAMQGYVFAGWIISGQATAAIENLSEDITVYAVFELTRTINIVFRDYDDSQAELLEQRDVIRTAEYSFETKNITSLIYSAKNVLPIAYYDAERALIDAADLSAGAAVTVYVKTATARELQLEKDYSNGVTVAWIFDYTDDDGPKQAVKTPSIDIVFAVPVGATVTMTALHANISDILVDNVSKGQNLNGTTVQAVFELAADEYAASVTFKTVLTDITTVSFVGDNHLEIVYPNGWDGYLASVDLDRTAFLYDELNTAYLVVYTINGTDHYFDELAGCKFNGDTTVFVTKVRNRFSFTLVYADGIEKFENLVGRQTLEAAFGGFSESALELLNTIFAEGSLYTDDGLQETVTAQEALATVLRGNLTIYSDWSKPIPEPPAPPVFEDADYTGYSFVDRWTSLFIGDGDILSSELILTADGLYTYKTYINGVLSANISGVYRLENGAVALKTFDMGYDYPIVTADDLLIDIEFSSDGLIRAAFVKLSGTSVTKFEQTLTRGAVRPVNYTGRDFPRLYTFGEITVELLANGKAVITYGDITDTVYYRATEDGRLFIYSNGIFGTGEITGLLGGEE